MALEITELPFFSDRLNDQDAVIVQRDTLTVHACVSSVIPQITHDNNTWYTASSAIISDVTSWVTSNSSNAYFDNVTIGGNLTVESDSITLNTVVQTTSALEITNSGTGPALVVTQTGNEAVAAFYDDAEPALYIDGKDSSRGYIGIRTDSPSESLHVVGNNLTTGTTTTSSVRINGRLIRPLRQIVHEWYREFTGPGVSTLNYTTTATGIPTGPTAIGEVWTVDLIFSGTTASNYIGGKRQFVVYNNGTVNIADNHVQTIGVDTGTNNPLLSAGIVGSTITLQVSASPGMSGKIAALANIVSTHTA